MRMFLSHSSRNNAHAIAIHDWLAEQGWDDVFLDLDRERGIAAGERWERALSEAANRCEAVIFLVSGDWLKSDWCIREFNLARRLNKRMFGALIEDMPLAALPRELTENWQTVNLAAGNDHEMRRTVMPDKSREEHVTFSASGLRRLRAGLDKAGLDPRFFAWPPDNDSERPPYRGLRPLEAEDAGIFFGRDAQIVTALDTLRGLREAAPPRLLVILGASGAGKSSVLRAGLLPRLARDDRNFLPLAVIRPERAVLSGETGLVRSLEIAFKSHGLARTRAELKAIVNGGAATLQPLLVDLIKAAASPRLSHEDTVTKPPMLVLAIDQCEELFLTEGAEEAKVFLALLRALVDAHAPDVIALFTIRNDSYEALQSAQGPAEALAGVKQVTLSLPPMPQGAYAQVIEGPAARLAGTPRALKIEPALTQTLLADIEAGGAKDALPLLAFTLERLYLEHGGDGDLNVVEYRALGGVRGSIEAAVEGALRSADAYPGIPKDRQSRFTLLRRGIIPWLASIDPDSGSPRRRVAHLSEIPQEARPLIDLLVEARLLATDVDHDTGKATIEPAHEALLRQWGQLEGWLEEDAAQLSVIEGVRRAAKNWIHNDRHSAWLIHSSIALRAAEQLRKRPDFAPFLGPTDQAYIRACRHRAYRQGALVLLLIGSAVGMGGLAYGGWLDQSYLTIQGRRFLDIYFPTVLTEKEEEKLQPGDKIKECASCPTLIVVGEGSFVMGSQIQDDEQPPREVVITRPFAVSTVEVTFDEWDACVAHGGCDHKPRDDAWGRGRQPVINVSWIDAKQYASWLSVLTGKTYRLLTEAEWEYTARAGSENQYSWIQNKLPNRANCVDCGSQWDDKRPAPAGSFRPNAYGIFDMHGNVWEWVEDCWHSNYVGAPPDASAWLSDCPLGIQKVIKGGSWLVQSVQLRASNRGWRTSDRRVNDIGFRVMRELVKSRIVNSGI